MRTLTMLIVAGLLALCVGTAHAEAREPLYAVLRTPKGYMVITSVRSICCLPTVKPALAVVSGDSGVSTI